METYHGYVRTPADAIKLFEACRLGQLPRVQRRLSEKERQSIRSGSVFVWDEREAGMRRWTDGKSWSASRVSGSFLTYREMEGKRGSGFGNNTRRSNGRTPDSGRHSDDDLDGEPEGYRYKADGLMKQSFSITTSQGQHLHLISYYTRPHPGAPDLPQPSTDPTLRHIVPAKGMYPESSLHDAQPPALTRAPMPTYNNPAAAPPDQPPYGYVWGPQGWMLAWPPSPSGTPPWAQAKGSPDLRMQSDGRPPSRSQAMPHMQTPPQHLPMPHSASAGQTPIYPKEPLPYEGERLPPPSVVRTFHHAQTGPPTLSPRLQQLQQAAAHAVMIDPRLAATSVRNPQGPLPAMAPGSRGLTPPRTHSVSPPRANSEAANGTGRGGLQALLHPTPANSEPTSANPATNSANSSPRNMTSGTVGLPAPNKMQREDARALSALDRKFHI